MSIGNHAGTVSQDGRTEKYDHCYWLELKAILKIKTLWIKTTLGHDRYAFITTLTDHEYMRGIQEKVALIKAFQRKQNC